MEIVLTFSSHEPAEIINQYVSWMIVCDTKTDILQAIYIKIK